MHLISLFSLFAFLALEQCDAKLGISLSQGSVGPGDDHNECDHIISNLTEAYPCLHLRKDMEQKRSLEAFELEMWGGNPEDFIPLGMCEGDCDDDSECESGLVCFQRDSGPVPGCLGSDDSKSDYCIRDSSAVTAVTPPTTRPTMEGSTKPSSMPTIREPTTPSPTIPSPTTTITGVIETAGNNGWPAQKYPLQHCQGDCDTDSDCRAGLICYQGGGDVPRCSGMPDPATDYCIVDQNLASTPTNPPVVTPSPPNYRRPSQPPTTEPTPVPTRQRTSPTRMPTYSPTPIPTLAPSPTAIPEPFNNIRLRLYWEEGYTWQDSTREMFWCMMSDYRGKPGTGRCWHGVKTQPCNKDQMYVATCNNDKRQRFSIIFVSHEEVMIKVANDNRCFEAKGQAIYLRSCDATNNLQRWISDRGAFFQKRFEITSPLAPDFCASQQHHPKPGEVVYLESCEVVRHPYFQTSFWMRW